MITAVMIWTIHCAEAGCMNQIVVRSDEDGGSSARLLRLRARVHGWKRVKIPGRGMSDLCPLHARNDPGYTGVEGANGTVRNRAKGKRR
jgi:hypothetical protein